jgi:hypothetical protein
VAKYNYIEAVLSRRVASRHLAVAEFLDDTGVPDRLPFAPDRYFVGGKDVPLRLLDATRAREKGIHNARVFMWRAYIGEADRRKPISVRPTGDGRFEVLDGNSTYANAVASRWPSIRAEVVDGVGHTASSSDVTESDVDSVISAVLVGSSWDAANARRVRQQTAVLAQRGLGRAVLEGVKFWIARAQPDPKVRGAMRVIADVDARLDRPTSASIYGKGGAVYDLLERAYRPGGRKPVMATSRPGREMTLVLNSLEVHAPKGWVHIESVDMKPDPAGMFDSGHDHEILTIECVMHPDSPEERHYPKLSLGQFVDLTGLPRARVEDIVADAYEEQASDYEDRLFYDRPITASDSSRIALLIGPNIPLLRRAVEQFTVQKLKVDDYPVVEIDQNYIHIHFDGWQGTARELERKILGSTPSLTDFMGQALDDTDFRVDFFQDMKFPAPDKVSVPIRMYDPDEDGSF